MTDSRIDQHMNELETNRLVVLDNEQDAKLLILCTAERWPTATLTRCYRVAIPDDHVIQPASSLLGSGSS